METSRLEIGCAAIKYLVPAGHPAPLRIRDRLDGILRRELPRTLARVFDSQFSDSDPSIWIIQQLDIQAAVNAAGEPEHITRALATQLGRSLNAALQEGDQNNVRHFPNRAAYLADRANNPAEIHSFEASEMLVRVFGDTALVTGLSTID